MCPVIGQPAQFSATKESARFLRINNPLLPFFELVFVVKSLLRFGLDISTTKYPKRALFYVRKGEFLCTPIFLVSAVKRG